MADKYTCQGRVSKGDYFTSACGRSAAYEHDGKHFCKTHHPPTVKAKNEAKHAEWVAKFECKQVVREESRVAAIERQRRADCFPALLGFAESVEVLLSHAQRNGLHLDWDKQQFLQDARVVIAQATGGAA